MLSNTIIVHLMAQPVPQIRTVQAITRGIYLEWQPMDSVNSLGLTKKNMAMG
jgi:hypothetical protein